MTCKHTSFRSTVNVVQGWKGEGTMRADVAVYCTDCGQQFMFPHTPLPEGVTDEEIMAGPWVARLPMVLGGIQTNHTPRDTTPTTPDPLAGGYGNDEGFGI